VNVELSAEARTFGELARKAIESAGGDELLRRAEQHPEQRERIVAPVLTELGAWDLDPRADFEELEAAAALCRSSGHFALPYPVAERLCRPADLPVDGMVVVGASAPAAAVGGLDLRWAAVTLEGRRSRVLRIGPSRPARTSAFVVDLELEDLEEAGARDLALGLVLPGWTLLGMLDRAVDLTRAYVLERRQFGQPLSAFQGVQFQLADAEVERAGAEELGKYALWSAGSSQPDAVADALAFRLVVLEAADVVFRVAHQLHGAIGFCDETALSWLSRYSAPLRRLPVGVSGTLAALQHNIGRRGLRGLFTEGCLR